MSCGRRCRPRKTARPMTAAAACRLPVGVDLQCAVDRRSASRRRAGRRRLALEAAAATRPADGRLHAGPREPRQAIASTDRRAARRPISASTSSDARSTARSRLEEGPGGVVAALIDRPDLDGMSMRLVAKGDAAAGTAELTVSAGDAVAANGNAPIGSRTARRPRSRSTSKPPGRACRTARSPMPCASRPLTARGDGRRSDRRREQRKLKAGPPGLDATGRYDRMADRLDGHRAARCRAGSRLRRSRGRRDVARPAHRRRRPTSGPGEQAAGHGRRSGQRRGLSLPRSTIACRRFGAVTLAASSAWSATASSRSMRSNATTAAGLREGRRRLICRPDRGRRRQDHGRAAQPGAVLGARPPPLAGAPTSTCTARQRCDGLTFGWQGTLDRADAPDAADRPCSAPRSTLSGTAALRRDATWPLRCARGERWRHVRHVRHAAGRDRHVRSDVRAAEARRPQPDLGGSA